MGLTAEAVRLRALHAYDLLGTPPEAEFDAFAGAAARLCGAPVGLISLIDRDRLFFKAHVGTDVSEIPRLGSFCAQAVQGSELFEVDDAEQDERFRQHPWVRDRPHLRFYAGAPLVNPAGAALGTLCIIDWRPRALTETQREALRVLGRLTAQALERRKMELTRRRARTALERDVLGRIRAIMRRTARLRVPPEDLVALLSESEEAAQLVEAAAEALEIERPDLLRARESDLGTICRSLASALHDPSARRTLKLAVAGDCRGSWDSDRISGALGTLIELALGSAGAAPVQVSVEGSQDAVCVTIRSPNRPRDASAADALHLDLAGRIAEIHGGSLDVGPGPEGVTMVFRLPRAPR